MSSDVREAFAPDIEEELADERFPNRKHGARATYALGCHGPLCRWAETLRARRHSERKAEKEFRDFVPSRRTPRDDSRAAELDAAIAWHGRHLEEQRALVKEEDESLLSARSGSDAPVAASLAS